MKKLASMREVLLRCDPTQEHFDPYSEVFLVSGSDGHVLEVPLSNRTEVSGTWLFVRPLTVRCFQALCRQGFVRFVETRKDGARAFSLTEKARCWIEAHRRP